MVSEMHVNRIVSNVKSGVEAALAPCTLVVGPNASGKSALVAALELIVTGRSSEVGAAPAAIAELSPTGDVEITAGLSDGRSVEYQGATRAGAAKLGAMLKGEVTDLLSKEPKRLRESLLSICCDKVDASAVAAQVPDAFRSEWLALWARCAPEAGNPADTLIATVELIRSELRASRAVIKKAPEGERPDAPSAAEIESMRTRAEEARKAVWTDEESERAAAKLNELRARSAAPGAPEVDYEAIRIALHFLEKLSEVVQAAQQMGAKDCVLCRHPGIDWQDRVAALQARVVKHRETLRLTHAGAAQCDVEALERAAARAPSGVTLADLAAIEQECRTAERLMLERKWWDEKAASASAAQASVDVLKALEGVANRIIADVLQGSISDFCARASKVVGSEVSIQLFDKHKPVCHIGVGDRSWRVLSGAERARFTAGFACAMAARTEGIKVVVIDDVGLDSISLPALCAGLSAAVKNGQIDQAIVCTITDWNLSIPDWQKVNTGVGVIL